MAEDFGSIARDTERISLSDLGLGRWSRVFTSGASDCCFYRAVAGGGDIDPYDIVIAMKNYVDQRLEGGIDDEDGIESFDASDASNRYEDILKHLGGANSSNPIRDENRGGQDIDMWAACGAMLQRFFAIFASGMEFNLWVWGATASKKETYCTATCWGVRSIQLWSCDMSGNDCLLIFSNSLYAMSHLALGCLALSDAISDWQLVADAKAGGKGQTLLLA